MPLLVCVCGRRRLSVVKTNAKAEANANTNAKTQEPNRQQQRRQQHGCVLSRYIPYRTVSYRDLPCRVVLCSAASYRSHSAVSRQRFVVCPSVVFFFLCGAPTVCLCCCAGKRFRAFVRAVFCRVGFSHDCLHIFARGGPYKLHGAGCNGTVCVWRARTNTTADSGGIASPKQSRARKKNIRSRDARQIQTQTSKQTKHREHL